MSFGFFKVIRDWCWDGLEAGEDSSGTLQEQLRRQQAELEELRALRQKYEAQQKELRQRKKRSLCAQQSVLSCA
ncbi:hypothetical protein Q1695_011853 [Nippostrongylus brasiliensis]|nr:hypothetical protein Q1695_011853 [Nippostrongylus brasiliensis]